MKTPTVALIFATVWGLRCSDSAQTALTLTSMTLSSRCCALRTIWARDAALGHLVSRETG